jgi:hypothetical protein
MEEVVDPLVDGHSHLYLLNRPYRWSFVFFEQFRVCT